MGFSDLYHAVIAWWKVLVARRLLVRRINIVNDDSMIGKADGAHEMMMVQE